MYAQFARTLSRLRHEKGVSQRQAAQELGVSKRCCPTMKTGFGSLAWPLWSELAITTKSQQTTCWGGRTSRGRGKPPPFPPRRRRPPDPAGRALPGAVPPQPRQPAILSRWAGELAQGAGEKPAAPPRKSKAVKV